MDIAAHAIGVDHLAEQDGAAVTELGNEMAELVAGIGHRNRVRPVRNTLAGEDLGSLRAGEPVRIEAEVNSKRPVQLDQSRRSDGRRGDACEKVRRQRRIGIFEVKMHRHGSKIGIAKN